MDIYFTITLNGKASQITDGYIKFDRVWENGDTIAFNLDMRTRVIKPTPYGSEILMNKVIWGKNYMIPTFDEEDPQAKKIIALIRGPIVLAEEDRLGFDITKPAEIVYKDGFVDAEIATNKIAPYENIIEVTVPTKSGYELHLTDYSSAGKIWTDECRLAAWILNDK